MSENYETLCEQINKEFKKIKNPSVDDLSNLSKKLKVDISILRECIGIKDIYEFQIDKD